MPNTVLGKVSVTPKGAWSGSSSYEQLDIVSNGGNSYIALQNVPSGTALSNSSYWLMIAQKGDKGNTGEITGASASISGGYGTPSVSVTSGGTSTDRSFAFAFSNLKGNGISAVNCEKTGTSGAVDTYTLTISEDDGTVNTFALEVTNGSVTSVNGRTGAVTGLAEDNGYYDEMTVGGAEQLISSTYVDDSVPYVFRTSGGSADIGDREFDEIHGGTIAWNQLTENGNFVGTTGWTAVRGTISASDNILSYTLTEIGGGYTQNRVTRTLNSINTHKYFGSIEVKPAHNTELRAGFMQSNTTSYISKNGGYSVTGSVWNSVAMVGTATASLNTFMFGCSATDSNGYEVGDIDQYRNVWVVDLTQMFGSAIADYIYSLEQSNTGSGVAFFRSLFSKPYYPYNTGELISVSGLSAHKMTGFNQFNDTIVVGTRWRYGEYKTGQTNNYAANATPFKCVPNTTYCICLPNVSSNLAVYIQEFDADGKWLRTQSYFAVTPTNKYHTFTTGTDVNKIAVSCYRDGVLTSAEFANANINLHWDGERDGEYEPYESHEYALDDSLTLRGIPKLDADNKLYYDGDIYSNDGSVTRRYGIVDLGSLTWTTTTNNRFKADISDLVLLADNNSYPNGIMVGYLGATPNNYISYDKVFHFSSSVHTVYVRDTTISTAEAFKTAMNGVYLVYELATPTTESAEPYTNPQIVDDWGTEEYVIAEQSGVKMPVGHETKYTANLKAKLEMAPNSPSGDGDYIVRQTGGINTYVPLTERIPNAPSENGNYILKCTVSGSTVTYVWESAT